MNSLTKVLLEDLLEVENKKVTAIYGGGFKPPTKGHYNVVEKAAEQNPEIDDIIIYVGGGERDGITQGESIQIWELYKKYLPLKTKIEPSKAPVGDILRYAKEHPDEEVLWIIGARENNPEDFADIASRTRTIDKYPNLQLRVIQTAGGVSGTAARKAVRDNNKEQFFHLIPDIEEKEQVWDIVSPIIKEGLMNNIKSKFKTFISAVKQENKETKEAVGLLIKAAKGDIKLSDSDKEQIGDQLKDVLKLVGLTAIATMPGGFIAAALIKLFKAEHLVTPSSMLNEGRYDSLTRIVVKDILNDWKEQFNGTSGDLEFEEDYETTNSKGEPINFELYAVLKVKETKGGTYKVDGGADPLRDPAYLEVKFQVDPRDLPQKWEDIYMDLTDVVRHEIEHMTQQGSNVISSKEMSNDEILRNLINLKLLPKAEYFKLEQEIDAMLQGMYLKAKKSKTPFKDVINDYFDKVKLSKKDRQDILDIWKNRAKALSLSLNEYSNTGPSTPKVYIVKADGTYKEAPIKILSKISNLTYDMGGGETNFFPEKNIVIVDNIPVEQFAQEPGEIKDEKIYIEYNLNQPYSFPKANKILAAQVVYHLDNIKSFAKTVNDSLKDGGTFQFFSDKMFKIDKEFLNYLSSEYGFGLPKNLNQYKSSNLLLKKGDYLEPVISYIYNVTDVDGNTAKISVTKEGRWWKYDKIEGNIDFKPTKWSVEPEYKYNDIIPSKENVLDSFSKALETDIVDFKKLNENKFLPLTESIVEDRIECDNCGWSWPIKDDGDDLYICHKCGHDNNPDLEEGTCGYDTDVKTGKKLNTPGGLEEGRPKKKDPKKGTGKKPEGSGRRLYTDEDPKDTVRIKFKTKEDIVDTLNKKQFKAKSHARQSQVINLIHQRVRAAYGKAKDPEVKARLKRALDYIESRKESSKKKTERLRKMKEASDPQAGTALPYGSGFAPVKELVTANSIICDNCGWKWAIKDGGNDLFICHKCGHDNTPKPDLFGLKTYALELAQGLEEELTKSDLNQIERIADEWFEDYGIDVEFTNHFLERVNNPRNGKPISAEELEDLFIKTAEKYGKKLSDFPDNFQAVLNDLRTSINLPFALNYDDKNNEMDLVAKTIMRKRDFKTTNPKLPLEELGKAKKGH